MDRFRWLEIHDSDRPAEDKIEATDIVRDPDYYLQEAQRKYNEGLFEPALRDYSSALRFDRNLIPAWLGQVRCLINLGELNEALLWVKKSLDSLPDSPDLNAARASVLARLGRRKEALAYSDASLSLRGGSDYVWLVRAEVLLSSRKRKLAQHCIDKALESAHNNWIILSQTGLICLENRFYTRAVDYLTKAVELNGSNAYLWLLLGRCYQGLRLYSKAKFAFEKSLEIRPHYSEAQKNLSDIGRRTACFVATYVFGSDSCEEVITLKAFRDNILTACPCGRLMVEIYYKIGPILTGIVKRIPGLAVFVRKSLVIFARVINNSKV